jgi:hypothetical protein
MTSQIVLMNGFGVALASDSAMTVGARTRTYETAEKIIPLPEPHRLAAMIAGNSRIGNLPYSLLLGEWTRQLGSKALRSVRSYHENFIDWLQSNSQLLAEDTEETQVLHFVENRLRQLSESFAARKSEDQTFEFQQLISEWTSEVREYGRLEGLSEADALNLMTKYSAKIDERIEYFLRDIEGYTEQRIALSGYFAAFYSSEWMTNSTLVFAGYGEKDILPSFVRIDISGLAQGRVTHQITQTWELTANTNPLWGICLPAQSDAIDQYLRGHDENFFGQIAETALTSISELGNQIVEQLELDDELAHRVKDIISEHQSKLDGMLDEARSRFTEDNYLTSLRQTMSSLAPADLVDVSRSLIELQALRQTTTGQLNTVGGPIDVAMISPLTGFEWIRHKAISKR